MKANMLSDPSPEQMQDPFPFLDMHDGYSSSVSLMSSNP